MLSGWKLRGIATSIAIVLLAGGCSGSGNNGSAGEAVDWALLGQGAGWTSLALIALIVAIGTVRFGLGLYRQVSDRHAAADETMNRATERLSADQTDSAALWEFSRTTLQTYMDRNIGQLQLAFFVSVVVMSAGFVIIGFGAMQMLTNGVEAGAVSSAAGVLVEYIGASLLRLTFTTMAQAERYVAVLERINAVQMSIGVAQRITSAELKNETLAGVSHHLLRMYLVAPAPAVGAAPPAAPGTPAAAPPAIPGVSLE